MSDIKYKIDNVNEESSYVGNMKLPSPPNPGEYMICQLCGNPILPKEISKLPNVRKRELKWHIHNKCYLSLDDALDMSTPGLMHSRYGTKDSLHKLVKQEMNKQNEK